MMNIPRAKAIRLLSSVEQRFYEASRRGVIDDHGAAGLRKWIRSVRKYVDKARQASIQQGRKKAELATRGESPLNSRLKHEVLADILGRFEKALERTEARLEPDRPRVQRRVEKLQTKQEARAEESLRIVKKSATKKAKKKSGKKNKKKAQRELAKRDQVVAQAHQKDAPKGADRIRKGQKAAVRTHIAHGAARGQRRQAKRDAR